MCSSRKYPYPPRKGFFLWPPHPLWIFQNLLTKWTPLSPPEIPFLSLYSAPVKTQQSNQLNFQCTSCIKFRQSCSLVLEMNFIRNWLLFGMKQKEKFEIFRFKNIFWNSSRQHIIKHRFPEIFQTRSVGCGK